MPDDLNQGAAGAGGNALGQFVLFFFEIGEFDFYQFVKGQLLFDAGEKSLAHSPVPHFKDGIEKLCLASQETAVCGC